MSADSSNIIPGNMAGWRYLGAFLDEGSREALLGYIRQLTALPDGWSVSCDHMTVLYNDGGETAERLAASYTDRIGESIELTVTHVGRSDSCIAVRVDGFESRNAVPHVTVAVAPGARPVMSNQITEWKEIPDGERIRFLATFGIKMDSKAVEFDIRKENVNFANDGTAEDRREDSSRQDHDERREDDRRGVPHDPAGAVSLAGDLRDIRLLEGGLAAAPGEYPVHVEEAGERRESERRESERLIAAAKTAGLYIAPASIGDFGKQISFTSNESLVFHDEAAGRVYKVRDPFALSLTKKQPPEDAIYEHIIHNIYFPEARYRFEGITEHGGTVRIILSQPFIGTYLTPTNEEIFRSMKERGLSSPPGAYTVEDDDVFVTDHFGDNVLKGEDGTLFFIDPSISFKRPAREIIEKHLLAEREGERLNQNKQQDMAENISPSGSDAFRADLLRRLISYQGEHGGNYGAFLNGEMIQEAIEALRAEGVDVESLADPSGNVEKRDELIAELGEHVYSLAASMDGRLFAKADMSVPPGPPSSGALAFSRAAVAVLRQNLEGIRNKVPSEGKPSDTTKETVRQEEESTETERNSRRNEVVMYGATMSYDADKTVTLSSREAALLKAALYPGGFETVAGSEGRVLVRQEDLVKGLMAMKHAIKSGLSIRPDAVSINALSAKLGSDGIWDLIESMDRKVSLEALSSEGSYASGFSIFGGDYPDGYRNDVKEGINRMASGSARELVDFESHKWRQYWTFRDLWRADPHRPAYPAPSKENLDMLRASGSLTKDSFNMSPNDVNRISSDFIKSKPELGFLERFREFRQDAPKMKPYIMDTEGFLKKTLEEGTSVKRQLEMTGRYEGFFKVDDKYVICEKGPEAKILYMDCESVLSSLVRQCEEDGWKLTDGGETYAITRKELGEMAYGRTVELRDGKGEYHTFAYSVSEDRIVPKESFEKTIKSELQRKESKAVKEAVKKSQEQRQEPSRDTGKGLKH